ncbi:Flagellar hook-length control protein FliK [Pelagimonas phthalicica]|uniref:Flagellar hook-length control protein FliK n=1 Tax=Pelagimonas phthalicica TaxID=1037362 RepID=A0A238J6A4_9RHOB|nr:flagellar hook-length control protein FliK [Pelagimonas phthalicica]TDS95357.1 flagellar hook-length control protein FliK [Pelagimonas phthalicica]SMX26119.1 Flagellar hook-length control protein FliK [Pelagimonas phthalicica]
MLTQLSGLAGPNLFATTSSKDVAAKDKDDFAAIFEQLDVSGEHTETTKDDLTVEEPDEVENEDVAADADVSDPETGDAELDETAELTDALLESEVEFNTVESLDHEAADQVFDLKPVQENDQVRVDQSLRGDPDWTPTQNTDAMPRFVAGTSASGAEPAPSQVVREIRIAGISNIQAGSANSAMQSKPETIATPASFQPVLGSGTAPAKDNTPQPQLAAAPEKADMKPEAQVASMATGQAVNSGNLAPVAGDNAGIVKEPPKPGVDFARLEPAAPSKPAMFEASRVIGDQAVTGTVEADASDRWNRAGTATAVPTATDEHVETRFSYAALQAHPNEDGVEPRIVVQNEAPKPQPTNVEITNSSRDTPKAKAVVHVDAGAKDALATAAAFPTAVPEIAKDAALAKVGVEGVAEIVAKPNAGETVSPQLKADAFLTERPVISPPGLQESDPAGKVSTPEAKAAPAAPNTTAVSSPAMALGGQPDDLNISIKPFAGKGESAAMPAAEGGKTGFETQTPRPETVTISAPPTKPDTSRPGRRDTREGGVVESDEVVLTKGQETRVVPEAKATLTMAQPAPATNGAVTYPFILDGEDTAVEFEETLFSSVSDVKRTAETVFPTQQTIVRPSANHVMRQIAEVANRMSDGGVELRLSPEELGTVRMQFVTTEQGLTVNIQADRPETLDLIRKNIDQLARDLADSGFENAGFSFGDDGSQGHQNQFGSRGGDPVAEEVAVVKPQQTAPQDGLDIRV